MRRIVSTALTVLMAFSLMLALSSTVNANALAGGGNSSSYSGESVFTNQPAGGSGQFSAIFFNDGSTTWAPGVVGLLICAADKTTCNVTSPNAAYASGWTSATVYATVSATVPPGSNGFFIYNFIVPAGTPAGTSATFNGDVGLIASGLEFRPQGYFQINTTPGAAGGMTLSPASASLPVGGTQQFTANGAPAGATVNWSVTGGCGAVTSAGLFAATATNSATQPCNVVATAGGSSATAPINVFGPATQVACSANPTSVSGNGNDTTTVTATLKDANGNTVTNASGTSISFNNNTPTLITPTGQTVTTASSGVASVVYTTVAGSGSGTAQVSISSGSLTGCNQSVTITAVGTAVKTTATFSPTTIAADGTSMSRLRIIVTDANGNSVTTDGTTQITISRSSGASICTPGSAGPTTVSAGTANFTITSTTTPGTCSWDATTNNTSIAGSSATLTTMIIGAPNKLAASTTGSPAPVACDPTNAANCPVTVITVQDANGNRVTNPTLGGQNITANFATGTSCTGVSALTNPVPTGTTPSTAGRATFTFTSNTSTTGCTVTFTPPGTGPLSAVSTTTTTVVFNPGPAAGLACSFTPVSIFGDGSSTSTASVKIVDAQANATNSGTYSVSFSKTSGAAGTVLLTSSPQNTTNGVATFTVRSTAATYGTDLYTASGVIVGTATQNGTCSINTHA